MGRGCVGGMVLSEPTTAFHLGVDEVDRVLSGLIEHVLVALPAAWVLGAGLRANCADKYGPKVLWVGRIRHLRLLLRAEKLRTVVKPKAVRPHAAPPPCPSPGHNLALHPSPAASPTAAAAAWGAAAPHGAAARGDAEREGAGAKRAARGGHQRVPPVEWALVPSTAASAHAFGTAGGWRVARTPA